MDQYPKLIFDFVDQYPWILWISIPGSCGSVSQINFRNANDTVVKQWSKQWVSQRVAQGLHRGFRGGAQGAHRECTKSAQREHREHAVPISPNFFAFQAREMKFGEQNGIMRIVSNFWWHTVIYKFLVAHGHFRFSVAHNHFK